MARCKTAATYKAESRVDLQQLSAAPVAGACNDGGGIGQSRHQARAVFAGHGAGRAADAGDERSCAAEIQTAVSGGVMEEGA